MRPAAQNPAPHPTVPVAPIPVQIRALTPATIYRDPPELAPRTPDPCVRRRTPTTRQTLVTVGAPPTACLTLAPPAGTWGPSAEPPNLACTCPQTFHTASCTSPDSWLIERDARCGLGCASATRLCADGVAQDQNGGVVKRAGKSGRPPRTATTRAVWATARKGTVGNSGGRSAGRSVLRARGRSGGRGSGLSAQ